MSLTVLFSDFCSCLEEDVQIEDNALGLLTRIGKETSLRYAIQLITAASLNAAKRNAKSVGPEDISRAYHLFVDVKRSTQYLKDYQDDYMYNEVADGNTDVVMQNA
jgi:RuvB-like protein 2